MSSEPIILIDGVGREYVAGETVIAALKDVSISIDAGEMVAIIGASGSGKSTLMNILGCLDRPTSGTYRIAGSETSALSPDELAALRREHFGFIFQRYHLLPELTALGNVEVPAVYAGSAQDVRRAQALHLLKRLGMENREGHRPGQLSGGQQQRVSIARALINGGDVILADEPTGALDSQSGKEVLQILGELHSDGKTVIIVTHDPSVASTADRIIELKDGEVVSDRRLRAKAGDAGRGEPHANGRKSAPWAAAASRLRQAFLMAVHALHAHQMRTLLTMLGIIIGIASVVCVVALGAGSQQKVLANISSLGTNTLEIFAGRNFGDTRSGKITTLVVSDADQLATQPYAAAVTPTVSSSDTVRFETLESNAQINGVGEQYFLAKGAKLAVGRLFDAESVRMRAQEVVIDDNTRKALFADDPYSGLGEVIFIGQVPCRVIGVIQPQQGGFGSSENLPLYLPYTTVQTRILGSASLRSITLRVKDNVDPAAAEQAVTAFLTQMHGSKDFFIINTDDIRRTITSTTQTLTLLVAAIAVISLIVGGIGVMNIMLVSVSERVPEIGVRMAVGARQADILQQFLIEAVLVCVMGGIFGIAVALGFGVVFSSFNTDFQLVYSPTSIIVAVVCSSIIGVAFGYLPARNASRLDPVVALSRE